LAIELAAARIGVLSVKRIAERLDDSLILLTAGGRTALPRHRTLRATLEWSHELLGEPERKLFRRLSVFAGGLTLEAAEAVGAGDLPSCQARVHPRTVTWEKDLLGTDFTSPEAGSHKEDPP
jgi:predicted ATPase